MIPAFTPLCPACHQPMQKWNERTDGNGKVIAVGYLCACQGSIYYENYYAGDTHKEKISASQVLKG